MTNPVWTHDAILASCVAVVGTVFTTIANNVIAAVNAARTARNARAESVEDDARDDRRFAAEHDANLQEMALKTWGAIYDALNGENARLKARVSELESLLREALTPKPPPPNDPAKGTQ